MKAQRKLKQWGVSETQPVSPSVAIPLIRAAYDESREELQNLWATLIAAAMDPARANRVRLSFIETLRQFDPLDALILRTCTEIQGIENNSEGKSELGRRLARADDEVWLSIENLQRLNCILPTSPMTARRVPISRYGRALIRTVSD